MDEPTSDSPCRGAPAPVVAYAPPTPPAGQHRYIFVLFRQVPGAGGVAVPSSQRKRWDVGRGLDTLVHCSSQRKHFLGE